MRAIVFMLSCLLAGCSGSDKIHDTTQVESFTLTFVDQSDFSQGDREEVVEAVKTHSRAWTAFFNGRVLPAVLIEVRNSEFLCAGVKSIGCTTNDLKIIVYRGEENDLPALFHEFCHRAPASDFYGSDGRHENPAWLSWTEHSYAVAEKLRDER